MFHNRNSCKLRKSFFTLSSPTSTKLPFLEFRNPIPLCYKSSLFSRAINLFKTKSTASKIDKNKIERNKTNGIEA